MFHAAARELVVLFFAIDWGRRQSSACNLRTNNGPHAEPDRVGVYTRRWGQRAMDRDSNLSSFALQLLIATEQRRVLTIGCVTLGQYIFESSWKEEAVMTAMWQKRWCQIHRWQRFVKGRQISNSLFICVAVRRSVDWSSITYAIRFIRRLASKRFTII